MSSRTRRWALGWLLAPVPVLGGPPLAQWSLATLRVAADGAVGVRDAAGAVEDPVHGNDWLVPGVVDQALQLEGVGAHVVRKAALVPRLTGSFTVEGWA